MHKAVELLGMREITKEEIDQLYLDLSIEDKDRIYNFYQNDFTKSLFNNDNYSELPFIYKVDYISNGIIDLLSVGDKVYVIDFKSDKNTSPEKLNIRYSKQLKAYVDVISQKYKDRPIEAKIYSFDLNDYVNIL